MKKLYALLLALSFATIAAEGSTQTVKHIIEKGETLSSIARKHHTTIVKVSHLNGLKKGDVIRFGKVLKVPTDAYVSSANVFPKLTKYVIKRGDTLSQIARKHHTSVIKLRKANALRKRQTLKIGKLLKIPQDTKTIKFAKAKKTVANKNLVAAVSDLKDTINLEKNKVEDHGTFKFSDIFVSKKDENSDKCKRIISIAKTKLGKKYVWGASGRKNTYDCSSFTKYVYRKNGISIPRTSINQSKFGKYVKRNNLQKGDLIFFDTSKGHKGYVNHVGIYLGNNKFIHASSAGKRVMITSLGKTFYSNRYRVARRPS